MLKKRAMGDSRWVTMISDRATLELSEGRVAGARYLTVHPVFDFNQFDFYHQPWHDMENWCLAQFGPTPPDGVWTPDARWYVNNRKFWFRAEADLTWFLLKWS